MEDTANKFDEQYDESSDEEQVSNILLNFVEKTQESEKGKGLI